MKKPGTLLLLCILFFWSAQYTYPVLLTDYVQSELGASAAFAGLIVGVYGFAQTLLRVPIGYASDRLRKRRPFIQVGILMTLVAGGLLYLAKGPGMALLGRAGAGVAASFWPIFTVLYGAYQGEERRTKAMGSISAIMYLSQLFATNVGSLTARALGTRSSFLLAMLLGLGGLLLSTRIQEVPFVGQPARLSGLRTALRNGLLWRAALITVLMQMVIWSTLYGFSPNWAMDVLRVDAGQLGLLTTAQLIPTVLFCWASGAKLAPRIGEKATTIFGCALMAASCLLMMTSRTFGQMLLYQVFSGIGVGCVGPMMLSVSMREIPQAQRGVAMGLYQSIYGLGMFLGPMIAGLLVESVAPAAGGSLAPGYRAVFLMAGLASLLGVLLSVFLPPDAPKRRGRIHHGT